MGVFRALLYAVFVLIKLYLIEIKYLYIIFKRNTYTVHFNISEYIAKSSTTSFQFPWVYYKEIFITHCVSLIRGVLPSLKHVFSPPQDVFLREKCSARSYPVEKKQLSHLKYKAAHIIVLNDMAQKYFQLFVKKHIVDISRTDTKPAVYNPCIRYK